jgi:hypothetical protein
MQGFNVDKARNPFFELPDIVQLPGLLIPRPGREHERSRNSSRTYRSRAIVGRLGCLVEGSRIRREYLITLGRLEGHGKQGAEDTYSPPTIPWSKARPKRANVTRKRTSTASSKSRSAGKNESRFSWIKSTRAKRRWCFAATSLPEYYIMRNIFTRLFLQERT